MSLALPKIDFLLPTRYLKIEIFQGDRGAQVTAAVPAQPGTSDDFLMMADKNPNTVGATRVGLAGQDAPRAEHLIDEAIEGNLDVLWVFGHDLVNNYYGTFAGD